MFDIKFEAWGVHGATPTTWSQVEVVSKRQSGESNLCETPGHSLDAVDQARSDLFEGSALSDFS